jgi:hypothetical protein
MRRAGHDQIQTTMGYVKLAEDLTGDLGTPFSPLPPSLVGVDRSTWTTPRSTQGDGTSERVVSRHEVAVQATPHAAFMRDNAELQGFNSLLRHLCSHEV